MIDISAFNNICVKAELICKIQRTIYKYNRNMLRVAYMMEEMNGLPIGNWWCRNTAFCWFMVDETGKEVPRSTSSGHGEKDRAFGLYYCS